MRAATKCRPEVVGVEEESAAKIGRVWAGEIRLEPRNESHEFLGHDYDSDHPEAVTARMAGKHLRPLCHLYLFDV